MRNGLKYFGVKSNTVNKTVTKVVSSTPIQVTKKVIGITNKNNK